MDFGWVRRLWEGQTDEERRQKLQQQLDSVHAARDAHREHMETAVRRRLSQKTPDQLARDERQKAAQQNLLDEMEEEMRVFRPSVDDAFDSLLPATELVDSIVIPDDPEEILDHTPELASPIQKTHVDAKRLYGELPIIERYRPVIRIESSDVAGGRLRFAPRMENGREVHGLPKEFVARHTGDNEKTEHSYRHEFGHLATFGTYPSGFTISEGLAEINGAVLQRQFEKGMAIQTDAEAVSIAPIKGMPEILDAEHVGGWSIPEFATVDYSEAPNALYAATANSFFRAVGSLNNFKNIVQMGNGWLQRMLNTPTGKRWIENDGIPIPRQKEWIDGIDEELKKKGEHGFKQRMDSLMNDTLPEGDRIVWTPNTENGGHIEVLSFARNPEYKSPNTAPENEETLTAIDRLFAGQTQEPTKMFGTITLKPFALGVDIKGKDTNGKPLMLNVQYACNGTTNIDADTVKRLLDEDDQDWDMSRSMDVILITQAGSLQGRKDLAWNPHTQTLDDPVHRPIALAL